MSNTNDLVKKLNQVDLNEDKSADDHSWNINVSKFAMNTAHPIRRMVETLKDSANPNKALIPLSFGDPTLFSDIEKPEIVKDILLKCVENKQFDSYTPPRGNDKAREAVAKFYSRPPNVVYKLEDIILAIGCTHALDMILLALANPGQNILISRPGFSVYQTLTNTFDIKQKYYNLIAEEDWRVDFNQMVSQIDENTVAIVVNNPLNPTGSVFSKQDLIGIINVAKQFRIPIIADEVYSEIVFDDKEFFYMSELSDTVPIISCNSISKRFNMPGWRFGWLAIHDPKNYLSKIREALFDLSTRLYAPSTITQALICELLVKTPESYFKEVVEILKINAELLYQKLSKLPGLIVRRSAGSIYMMIGIDFKCFPDIKDDPDFVVKLIKEQSVFLIPCAAFGYPGYLRIVITTKKDKIDEACDRIGEFIRDHYKTPLNQE